MKNIIASISFFALAIILAGGLMIGVSASLKDAPSWLRELMALSAFSGVLAVSIKVHDKLLKFTIGLRPKFKVFEDLPLSLVVSFLLFFFLFFSEWVFGEFHSNSVYHEFPFYHFLQRFLMSFFFTGIAQPYLEECIFRERLFFASAGRFGVLFGAILASVLFAFLHYSNFVYSLIFSLAMCFLYRWKGFWVCFISHSCFNFISILVDAF